MQEEQFRPLVSIIIPVYNGSNYLREAIDSALNQTYPNIEILVVNDGSTDGGMTESIALSYGGNIRYIFKNNGGVATALNLGIQQMKGEYFAWLSHDDLYYKEKVSKQVELLNREDNKKKIIYCDCEIFTGKEENKYRIIAGDLINNSIRYHLTIKSTIHGCSLLIPRSALLDVGLFDENLRMTQDYEMWFRLGGKYEFIYLPDCLVKSRHHSSQDSSRFSDELNKECDILRCGFIGKLSHEDIIMPNEKVNPYWAYLHIYQYMMDSGYCKAAKLALAYAANVNNSSGFLKKRINNVMINMIKTGLPNKLSKIYPKVKRALRF